MMESPMSWDISVVKLLTDNHFEEALDLTLQSDLNDIFDLSILISTLISKIMSDDVNVNKPVYNILKHFATNLACDDFIISIVEVNPNLNNSTLLEIIVELYLIVLLRKPKRLNILLSWCLASVSSALPTEKDPLVNVRQVFNILKHFFTCLQPTEAAKDACCSSILKILNKVPTELHLECVQMFLTFQCNLSYLFDNVNHLKNVQFHYDPVNEVPDVAVGLFLYYCFCTNIDNVPLIYPHRYKFLHSLPALLGLLGHDELEKQEMGVSMTKMIVEPIERGSLSLSDLCPNLSRVLQQLNYIMVYSETESLRKAAFNCFNAIIVSYNMNAQYNILINFRSLVTHSGTQAHLISIIKINFEAVLKYSNVNGLESFSGKRLCDLLNLYCLLNNGIETNLVENVEQILAATNLFWYLIRLQTNRGGLFLNLEKLRLFDYTQTLQQIVKDSLDNCKNELLKIEMGKYNSLESPISIKNLEMPELSKEDRLKSIFCARNATELVDEAVKRLVEAMSFN